MIYLAMAILASFSITLLIKDNEVRGANTQVVLASNYLSAGAIGWVFVLVARAGAGGGAFTVGRETLLLGLGGSVLFPGAFFLMMWGIRRYGVSLAGSVSRLSLTVPILFAALFLGERFALITTAGLAGAFVALLLLSPLRKKGGQTQHLDTQALWYFPTLVLIFGIVDLWVNLYNAIGPAEERFTFIVLIFSGAAALVWVVTGLRQTAVDGQSVVRGLILGVPNFFSSYLLMESLRSPTFAGLSAVVYALYSAVGVALTFAAGALIWREALTMRNQVGMALAVISVILLNLR